MEENIGVRETTGIIDRKQEELIALEEIHREQLAELEALKKELDSEMENENEYR